jgi:hypothetical protein
MDSDLRVRNGRVELKHAQDDGGDDCEVHEAAHD